MYPPYVVHLLSKHITKATDHKFVSVTLSLTLSAFFILIPIFMLSWVKIVYCLLSIEIFHHIGKMQDGNMENSQNKGNLLSY